MCENLINNYDVTNKFLITYIELLSQDKVVNISIALADLFTKMLEREEYRNDKRIHEFLFRLTTRKCLILQEKLKEAINFELIIDDDRKKQLTSERYANESFSNNMAFLKEFNIMNSNIPIVINVKKNTSQPKNMQIVTIQPDNKIKGEEDKLQAEDVSEDNIIKREDKNDEDGKEENIEGSKLESKEENNADDVDIKMDGEMNENENKGSAEIKVEKSDNDVEMGV